VNSRMARAGAALRIAHGMLVSSIPSIATSFTDMRRLEHNAFKVELAQRVAVRALPPSGARA
jgi:hypothetical protein